MHGPLEVAGTGLQSVVFPEKSVCWRTICLALCLWSRTLRTQRFVYCVLQKNYITTVVTSICDDLVATKETGIIVST